MKATDILQLLPRDVRGIGEEVINAMVCGSKVLSWNEKLELFKAGKAVPGTNIIRLLEYILYPEEEGSIPPRGFDQFLEGLKKIELESQWVRNTSVIKELDNNENGWDSDEMVNSESESECESEKSNGEDENDSDNDENMK